VKCPNALPERVNALPPECLNVLHESVNALPESVNADVQDPVTRPEKLRVQNAKSGNASTNYISVIYPHKQVTDLHSASTGE